MPDYCHNVLTVIGPVVTVSSFRDEVRDDGTRNPVWKKPIYVLLYGGPLVNHLAFWTLVPHPKEILAAGYSDAGYDWEIDNWSVKWGAMRTELVQVSPGKLEYSFDTPWGPPNKWMDKVAILFGNLYFRLKFAGEDNEYRGSMEWNKDVLPRLKKSRRSNTKVFIINRIVDELEKPVDNGRPVW